ncbi:c-type cytochrome [Bartonella doshiae]|uniref:c-type cytochrome n=1 Tax=Bartonella doshiae TaxID=33044 RepID=UPI0009427AAE|nr:c-type cytochrome [Bartonella doshiae]
MNLLKVTSFVCASLFLLIILSGIFVLSDMIYDNSAPVQRSYKVIEKEALKEKQQAFDTSLSLNDRLKRANLENGRKIFHQCAVCHTSGRNESGRVGPALWEIVDRPLAAATGFAYSRALRANSDQKWNFVMLDRYLRAPREVFPGTIMSFRGIKNNQDRADLLLYLRSLSDNPVPLPIDNK